MTKISVECKAELCGIDLWNVFDVNANVDGGESLIWQIKFRVIGWNANCISFGTNVFFICAEGQPYMMLKIQKAKLP